MKSKKSKEQSFIVQFKLQTELWQDDILNKRFNIGRKMYNALVTITQNRYNEMIKTKLYRNTYAELIEVAAKIKKYKEKDVQKQLVIERKNLLDILNNLRSKYKINEYAFHEDVKQMQHHFKKNIDSFTAQKIATRLWKSYDKLIFGDGEKVHYKKYDTLNSLEGKSNNTGIRIKDDKLIWNGLEISVIIDYKNPYEAMAMKNKIAYSRIIRKFVRGRYRFYVQIILKGYVPVKIDKETGEVKRKLGNGRVGLDIGTQTIAISSQSDVKILELSDRVQNIENEKRRISRKMDRSRRSMNPNNYNSDMTIKKQGAKKVVWIHSNKYKKLKSRLKELYRKQADIRKFQHEIMANYILSLGDTVFAETMNFKALQKRSKKTEKNDKGRFKRKKRFGKSITNKAPAMLLNIIDRKLRQNGLILNKIDTWSVKASQHDHTTGCNKKKKLSQRWDYIDGHKVQRDMYSAFLIMNVTNDMKYVDDERCKYTFANFLKMHELEVLRLTGQKNLSSIAI